MKLLAGNPTLNPLSSRDERVGQKSFICSRKLPKMLLKMLPEEKQIENLSHVMRKEKYEKLHKAHRKVICIMH